MNPFISAFNAVLYQPFFNALIALYAFMPGHDFGIAVIVLTVLIKFALYPLGTQTIRSQKALATLQPKIKEIQERFKNDKEAQAKASMELYKKEGINPFSGCLPILIQLPILIGLYQVFFRGFGAEQLSFLYSFLPNPGQIDTTFLGFLDLAKSSSVLAVLTGIVQFIQTKTSTFSPNKPGSKNDLSAMMQKQMLFLMPVFTIFILWRLPSAIALYWITSTLFTIVQQYIILKKQHQHD
jgi:YidC/Oxa1 family membrane protein insertase